MSMKWTAERALTLISALTLFGFGAWLFAVPSALAGIGIELDGPTARIDVRATYGGFELGVAAFLFLCVARPQWTRAGLVASGFAVAGFGAGRAGGIALEGGAEPLMWGFLGLELVLTVAIVVVLRRTRPAPGAPPVDRG
jgi:hypothetical protein